MERSQIRAIALGGMLTAAAVVLMSLGTLIPVNTYVCPVVCILLTRPVLKICGRRIALCYYLAVAVLSLLLAPDREAAFVYAFAGFYPLIQPWFLKIRPKALQPAAKIAFFTLVGLMGYGALCAVMGLEQAVQAGAAGKAMAAAAVMLWNLLFLMVDLLLQRGIRLKRK